MLLCRLLNEYHLQVQLGRASVWLLMSLKILFPRVLEISLAEGFNEGKDSSSYPSSHCWWSYLLLLKERRCGAPQTKFGIWISQLTVLTFPYNLTTSSILVSKAISIWNYFYLLSLKLEMLRSLCRPKPVVRDYPDVFPKNLPKTVVMQSDRFYNWVRTKAYSYL